MNGKNLMDDDLVDREAQQVDTYPLLMDHLASQQQEHVIEVGGDSPVPSSSSNQGEFLRSRPADVTPASSSSSAESLRSIRNYGGHRQRMSPLNSGLWISIELTVTVSQIIASIIVLSLSRDEKPQTPLSVWVAGYAAGCLATLPVLYWRYTHRHGPRIRDQESLSQSTPTASVPPSPRTASSYVSLSIPSASSDSRVTSTRNSESFTDNTSVARLVEKFKIALDCFFAVWFVVGNVWIFGGHSSSREAPNLYRLCIVFLTFSCIGYAMPFILCATICCCLPCIIALLGFREEQNQNRGASPEVIAALPVYKFKAKERDKGDTTTTTTNNSNNTDKIDKDSSDSESEGPNEGGVVAAGTDKERVVSGDDAVCCICLARYKDEEQLRELSCGHHFHVDCVDKWLKINSLCPLCKLDVGGGGSNDAAAATSAAAAVAADVDVVDDRTS